MRLADVFRGLTVAWLGLVLLVLDRLPFAQTCSEGVGKSEVCVGETAVESEGWKTILIYLLPPLILAVAAAISRNPVVTILASAVIFGFAVVGMTSVGLFLIPAALTSFVAVVSSVPSLPMTEPPTPQPSK